MPSPSHSSRFYHPHNIGWGLQIASYTNYYINLHIYLPIDMAKICDFFKISQWILAWDLLILPPNRCILYCKYIYVDWSQISIINPSQVTNTAIFVSCCMHLHQRWRFFPHTRDFCQGTSIRTHVWRMPTRIWCKWCVSLKSKLRELNRRLICAPQGTDVLKQNSTCVGQW